MRWFTGRQREGKTAQRPKGGSVPDGVRIYAVGDIHGRSDLLEAQFSQIDAHKRDRPFQRPIEVYLGDYIDRGPNSRGVIDLMISRQKNCEVYALAGNHEAMLLRAIEDPSSLADWLHWGGLATLSSYELKPTVLNAAQMGDFSSKLKTALPPEHLGFIMDLLMSFVCGDYFFAHAGVRPGVALDEQLPKDIMWIRDEFLTSEADFGAVIVHGHSPVEQPEIRHNRINVDTGAYKSSRLTCLVLEGRSAYFLPSPKP